MLSCVLLRFCLLLFSFWVVFEGKAVHVFGVCFLSIFGFCLSLLPYFYASPDSGNKAHNKNYIEQNQLYTTKPIKEQQQGKGTLHLDPPNALGGRRRALPPNPPPALYF